MPSLRGEVSGAEWEEWGVLGVCELSDGVSVYVADGALGLGEVGFVFRSTCAASHGCWGYTEIH